MAPKKAPGKGLPFRNSAHFRSEGSGYWTCILCDEPASTRVRMGAAVTHERTREHQRAVENQNAQFQPAEASWSWDTYDESAWSEPWKRQFDALRDMIPFFLRTMEAEARGGDPPRLMSYLDDVKDPFASDGEGDGWGQTSGEVDGWGRPVAAAADGWGRPTAAANGWDRPTAGVDDWGRLAEADNGWGKRDAAGWGDDHGSDAWGKPATWARSSVSSKQESHVNSALSEGGDLPSTNWNPPSGQASAPPPPSTPSKPPPRTWAQVARPGSGAPASREKQLSSFNQLSTDAKIKRIEDTARNLRASKA